MRIRPLLTIAVFAMMLSGCGYNSIQSQDEAVKAQWSEVLNQYQRRADLVPNLVATVKGFAAQEKSVLIEVTNARASVGKMNITAERPVILKCSRNSKRLKAKCRARCHDY
jgi:LemA protein